MADYRDHITCHVLNTHNGTPGANLTCYLTVHSIQTAPGKLHAASENVLPDTSLPLTFTSTTDQDGRVKNWTAVTPQQKPSTFKELSDYVSSSFSTPEAREDLRFIVSVKIVGVDDFYRAQGVESFWPEVEVKFIVKGWEGAKGWRHYHVPVLLGPWSYSTYRGS